MSFVVVRDRSRLGHKPDCRLGWSSEYVRKSMYACHSRSVACRPAETRWRRGEIGSIRRSILVGHRRPNRRLRVKKSSLHSYSQFFTFLFPVLFILIHSSLHFYSQFFTFFIHSSSHSYSQFFTFLFTVLYIFIPSSLHSYSQFFTFLLLIIIIIIIINSLYLCRDRRTGRTKKKQYNSKFKIVKVNIKRVRFRCYLILISFW